MYYENELSNIKKTWSHWLSSFVINEKRVIDKADRSKIAFSITNNFHKKKIAKFTIFTDKETKELYCKRIE